MTSARNFLLRHACALAACRIVFIAATQAVVERAVSEQLRPLEIQHVHLLRHGVAFNTDISVGPLEVHPVHGRDGHDRRIVAHGPADVKAELRIQQRDVLNSKEQACVPHRPAHPIHQAAAHAHPSQKSTSRPPVGNDIAGTLGNDATQMPAICSLRGGELPLLHRGRRKRIMRREAQRLGRAQITRADLNCGKGLNVRRG